MKYGTIEIHCLNYNAKGIIMTKKDTSKNVKNTTNKEQDIIIKTATNILTKHIKAFKELAK